MFEVLGFRFNPTDVELVQYFLKRKLLGKMIKLEVISEVEVYKYDPWHLPAKASFNSGELKWYFFCQREKKYAHGNRISRSTVSGYWKTSGNDRPVHYSGEVVGWVKTLIFHIGRAPTGARIDWVYEYRLEDQGLAETKVPVDAYVICSIFKKEGTGSKIAAHYGTPFNEADWSDDEVALSFQDANTGGPHLGPQGNDISPLPTNTHPLPDFGIGSSSLSQPRTSSTNVLEPGFPNFFPMEMPHGSQFDDILPSFGYTHEEHTFFMNDPVRNASMPAPNRLFSTNSTGFHDFSASFPERLGITPQDLGVGPSVQSWGGNILATSSEVLQPVSCDYVTMEKAPPSTAEDIQPIDNPLASDTDFLLSEYHNVFSDV